jgi:hypothetical protein
MLLRRARALIANHSQRVTRPATIRVVAPERRTLASAAALALALVAAPAGATPFAYVVGANNAIELVDVATNADASAGATVFATLTVVLLHRGRGDWGRILSLCVFAFSCVLLLAGALCWSWSVYLRFCNVREFHWVSCRVGRSPPTCG